MKHGLVMLSVGVLVACGGGVGEEYAEIVPTIYMAGGSCAGRLSDELDGAPTKTLFADEWMCFSPYQSCVRAGARFFAMRVF